MRVIVCGGRNYQDVDAIYAALDRIDAERGHISVVIHGNAMGADRWAGLWAYSRMRRVWACPAEWAKYGRSAGPRRNKRMLGYKPALVIAFPGGRGTRNMIKLALAAGVEVINAP